MLRVTITLEEGEPEWRDGVFSAPMKKTGGAVISAATPEKLVEQIHTWLLDVMGATKLAP